MASQGNSTVTNHLLVRLQGEPHVLADLFARHRERLRRWCRRNPVLGALTANVVCLPLVLVAGASLAAALVEPANQGGGSDNCTVGAVSCF
jgi:hypothetical protein